MLIEASISIEAYAAQRVKNGSVIVPGASETVWVRSETGGMVRFPVFEMTPPASREVQRVLWQGPAAVISYIVEPDEQHAPNALLYVCRDQSYSLEKLSKPARRDARRALRSLHIAPLEWPVLLEKGFPAFSDTLARIGLSEETPASFRRHYEDFSRNPCHRVIGALKDDRVVAYMTLIVVDDWVEIEGSFFTQADRGLCPSNGLAHYVLDYFLMQAGFRIVSYGTSSIQGETRDGLDLYKKKVGFEAVPVHRAFVLHPLLRPVANRATLWGINTALRFTPGNRPLKKAEGVLATLLGARPKLQIMEENIAD